MPKSLADGRIKFTILTTEPANPEAPTAAELNAGIDASCNILASDFTWGPADSDTVAEPALCDDSNAQSYGRSNYQAGITPFRYFDETTKNPDLTEDATFQAVKVKGTEIWGYARKTAKKASAVWAASDEIYFGAKVLTDSPQPPSDQGGYIKARVPMQVQDGYEYIAVAGA